MYSVFESLPEEKRQNIIQCALKEFAEKGYEQASTNTIVKEAGISKGILFHYFKTKKDLYRYVILYSIDKIYSRMLELINFKSTDFFERMLEISAVKMKIQLENPYVYTIVVEIYKGAHQDILKEIYDRYRPLMSEYFAKLNEGIDMSLFKEGTDINRINEMITWIAEGMSSKLLKDISGKVDEIEEVRTMVEDEFMKYAELLKRGVYKK